MATSGAAAYVAQHVPALSDLDYAEPAFFARPFKLIHGLMIVVSRSQASRVGTNSSGFSNGPISSSVGFETGAAEIVGLLEGFDNTVEFRDGAIAQVLPFFHDGRMGVLIRWPLCGTGGHRVVGPVLAESVLYYPSGTR